MNVFSTTLVRFSRIAKYILPHHDKIKIPWNRVWENLLLKAWYSCNNSWCDLKIKWFICWRDVSLSFGPIALHISLNKLIRRLKKNIFFHMISSHKYYDLSKCEVKNLNAISSLLTVKWSCVLAVERLYTLKTQSRR